MGIRFFYPVWSADRATSASESLGWFFSVLCTLRGIDGSPGLESARRKQRDDPVTAKELAGLRGLLGQLMWLATQVVPQLQAPLSLLLGYFEEATVSTLLEANKLARRALVWSSDYSSHCCS